MSYWGYVEVAVDEPIPTPFRFDAARSEAIHTTLAREMGALMDDFNAPISGRHRGYRLTYPDALLGGRSDNIDRMAKAIGLVVDVGSLYRNYWLALFRNEGKPGSLPWHGEEAYSSLPYWEWTVRAAMLVGKWAYADDNELWDAYAAWMRREAAMWCLVAADGIETDGFVGPGYAGCALRARRWNGRIGIRSINVLMCALMGIGFRNPWPNESWVRHARESGRELGLGSMSWHPSSSTGLERLVAAIGDTRTVCPIEHRWYMPAIVVSYLAEYRVGNNTASLWLGAAEAPTRLIEGWGYPRDDVRGPSDLLQRGNAETNDISYRWVPYELANIQRYDWPTDATLKLTVRFSPDAAPVYTGEWAVAAGLGGSTAPEPEPDPGGLTEEQRRWIEAAAVSMESAAEQCRSSADDLDRRVRTLRGLL